MEGELTSSWGVGWGSWDSGKLPREGPLRAGPGRATRGRVCGQERAELLGYLDRYLDPSPLWLWRVVEPTVAAKKGLQEGGTTRVPG